MGIISEEGWYKKDDLTHWISVFYCLCWDGNALFGLQAYKECQFIILKNKASCFPFSMSQCVGVGR
jgi:hypothetical protein